MYKNRKFKCTLGLLILLMVILSFKFIIVRNRFISYTKQVVFNVPNEKNSKNIEKYGYSDILEWLRDNKNFEVKSINMIENEKCNVEVNYNGDVKLLYNSLYSLNNSKNYLSLNKISISKDTKITSISINFRKNK